MTDKITPEMLDEARARVICNNLCCGDLDGCPQADAHRYTARAIREADNAEGYVLVPKEATAEMRAAGRPAHITHEKTMKAGIADIDHRAGVCINAAIRAGAIGGER